MELTIGQQISIIGILFIVISLCMTILLRKNAVIRRTQWLGLQVAIGLCLTVFVFYFKPSNLIRWDIFVHYDVVDALRGHDFQYALKYGGYKEFFLANAYFWTISRLPDNSMLPVIPIVIDYTVYLYIVNDRYKEEYGESNIEISQAVYTLFFWASTFGLKLAVSGLRCVTSCAIASLAMYFYCKDGKITIKPIILLIAAASIHSFALIIIPIYFFSKLRNKTPVVIAMVAINIVGSTLIKFLRSLIPAGFYYLQVSFSQIIKYWDSYSLSAVYLRSGLGMAILYLCMVAILIIQWYLTGQARNRLEKIESVDSRIFEYAHSLALVSVGMSFSYLFVERVLYLVSYSSIMTNTTNKNRYQIHPILMCVILILLLYVFYGNDIGTFIMNYSGRGWGS